MNAQINTTNIGSTPVWLRFSLGGALVLASLCVIIWVGYIFTAEYRFQPLNNEILSRIEHKEPLDWATLQVQLQRLIKLDPTNGEIRDMYATALSKLEYYNEARQQLEIARRTLNARNSLYFISDMYKNLGDIPKAESVMGDCLMINPTDPEFNDARLHLLARQLTAMNNDKNKPKWDTKTKTVYNDYLARYGAAAFNWDVRAPHDKNSYLFMANFYIEPLFALQAYRCFLVGFSSAPWLNLNPRPMVDMRNALNSINQIINGKYAKPYKNLP